MAFALERSNRGSRTLGRCGFACRFCADGRIALCFPAGCTRYGAFSGRRELHACAPRLREPDGDRLLRGARAMLALADVVHFFADEFPRLG